jgi:hypothetical protein
MASTFDGQYSNKQFMNHNVRNVNIMHNTMKQSGRILNKVLGSCKVNLQLFKTLLNNEISTMGLECSFIYSLCVCYLT